MFLFLRYALCVLGIYLASYICSFSVDEGGPKPGEGGYLEKNSTVLNKLDLQTAKAIATKILNRAEERTVNGRVQWVKQLALGLDNTMKDHSQDSHKKTDSYFVTNERDKVKNLINFVVSNADDFKVSEQTTVRGQVTRLTLRKAVSEDAAMSIFQTTHIGRDETDGGNRNHVVVCFDITGIKKPSDAAQYGAFFTAFPAREDFVCK